MGQTQLFPFHLALDHTTAWPQPRDIPQPVPSAGGCPLYSCLRSNGRAVTHSCPITRLPGYKALKNLLLSQDGVIHVARAGEVSAKVTIATFLHALWDTKHLLSIGTASRDIELF